MEALLMGQNTHTCTHAHTHTHTHTQDNYGNPCTTTFFSYSVNIIRILGWTSAEVTYLIKTGSSYVPGQPLCIRLVSWSNPCLGPASSGKRAPCRIEILIKISILATFGIKIANWGIDQHQKIRGLLNIDSSTHACNNYCISSNCSCGYYLFRRPLECGYYSRVATIWRWLLF